jgi:hypothetical protein
MRAARDFMEVLLKIMSVVVLPFFIAGYALYGARVWLWNIANRNALSGDFHYKIQKEDKAYESPNRGRH